MRVVQSQDDPARQQREEGKLQEDRSKAVVAKAISEATKAVEKASTEAQSFTAEVREGSDGTLSSRMSSPIEQVREVNRSEITVHSRGGRVVEDVKANMLQGIVQSASESERDDDEESDEDEAKKPATSDKQKRSSRDQERRKNRRQWESKLKDELSSVSTGTEVQGQDMMMIMKQRESTTASTMRNTSQRKAEASPEASNNRRSCPAGASRWYGHQEETVTANIENVTAEVESISSDMASERRQPVQMGQGNRHTENDRRRSAPQGSTQ